MRTKPTNTMYNNDEPHEQVYVNETGYTDSDEDALGSIDYD